MGIEALVGFGLFLVLYWFLASADDYEWNSEKHRFENWREKPEYKDMTYKLKGQK